MRKITLTRIAKRPSPWRVRFYENQKPVCRFFDSRESAVTYQRDLKEKFSWGISPADASAAARMLAGTGLKLVDVVRRGLEHTDRLVAVGTTVADGSAAALRRAREEGSRPKTVTGYESWFRIINRALGSRDAAMVSETDVRQFLAGLKGRDSGPAARATVESALRHVRIVLRAAGVENPVAKLRLGKYDKPPIEFLTIPECRTALGAARPEERGFVAIALFACLRPETLERMEPKHISVEQRKIAIPAYAAKDRRDHLLDEAIVPALLWEWLKAYPFQPMPWSNIQKRLKKAVGRWPHDSLRHTGATYFFRLNQAERTGMLLTHAGTALVRKHYAGNALTVNADEFFSLTPNSITFRQTACIPWPPAADLEAMLHAEPATKVAARLGCSDSALGKYCRKNKIAKRKRGEWTKIEAKSRSAA